MLGWMRVHGILFESTSTNVEERTSGVTGEVSWFNMYDNRRFQKTVLIYHNLLSHYKYIYFGEFVGYTLKAI